MASYRLTFGASLIAALLNVVFGGILAWVLVRYKFPGKRIIDALVGLPFALPTAVAGITLTALYSSNGWFGQFIEGLTDAASRDGFIRRQFVADRDLRPPDRRRAPDPSPPPSHRRDGRPDRRRHWGPSVRFTPAACHQCWPPRYQTAQQHPLLLEFQAHQMRGRT